MPSTVLEASTAHEPVLRERQTNGTVTGACGRGAQETGSRGGRPAEKTGRVIGINQRKGRDASPQPEGQPMGGRRAR